MAAVPILGYEFGLGNQVEQFAIIRRMADPNFIPGDFYTDSAVGFGPRYYYSLIIAALTKLLPLPVVVFVLTYLTNLALAGVTMDAVKRHLGGNVMAGALAGLMVVASSSFSLGYASYIHFQIFQPASPAIAFALAGFSALLAGRRLLAAPLFGAGALLHPLIGVEVAVVAFSACAFAEIVRARTPAAIVKAWLRYVPAGLLFATIIAAAWILPIFNASQPRIPDQEFFDILARFRAPHHYLGLEMPKYMVMRAGLYVVAIGWIAYTFFRQEGLRFGAVALAAAGLIAIGLCCLSVIFVDLLQNRTVTTLQLFRMLMVVKWVGRIFFAWMAARWIAEGKGLHWVAATAPVLVAGEAEPYVMLLAVVAMQTVQWTRPPRVVTWVLAAALVGVSIRYALMLGDWQVQERGMVAIVILIAFFGFARARRSLMAASSVMLAALIAFAVVNRDIGVETRGRLFNVNFHWDDLVGQDVDIARWAKGATPKDSLWIVPPEFESFRLFAERPVVADFTCLPFQDLALRGWRERMRDLYGEVEGGGFAAQLAMRANYRKGDVIRLQAAARKYGATYAVLYADTPWNGPVLFENNGYKAVKIFEAAP